MLGAAVQPENGPPLWTRTRQQGDLLDVTQEA